MKTNQINVQTQGTAQKLVFLNINRFFWSNKGKLVLLLDGGTAVAIHPNFLKARMGIEYTPTPRKSEGEAANTNSQVA